MHLDRNDILIITRYFADKPVRRAYVFGSFSRNTATEYSDVDILVELDYSKHIGFGFVQMKLDLEKQLQKPVDLVSSEAVSRHLLPFIEKDKQLIYESAG